MLNMYRCSKISVKITELMLHQVMIVDRNKLKTNNTANCLNKRT